MKSMHECIFISEVISGVSFRKVFNSHFWFGPSLNSSAAVSRCMTPSLALPLLGLVTAGDCKVAISLNFCLSKEQISTKFDSNIFKDTKSN